MLTHDFVSNSKMIQ